MNFRHIDTEVTGNWPAERNKTMNCTDLCKCGSLWCPRHLINLFSLELSIKILDNTLEGLDALQIKNGGLTDMQCRYYVDLVVKLTELKVKKEEQDLLADLTWDLQHG